MLSRASLLLVAFAAPACLQKHELFQDVPITEKHATGEACRADEDCVTANVCDNQVCTSCPPFMPCRQNFTAVTRNGCTWCAPANDCLSDEECGGGMVCYQGAQCPPGCDDPHCCYGNLCSDPSCGPPPSNLDCSRVGCADGSNCIGTGQYDGCACDPTTHTWDCMMHDGEQNQCDGFRGGGGPSGSPGGRM